MEFKRSHQKIWKMLLEGTSEQSGEPLSGIHKYKYLYYLIGSCQQGYFLQIVLTSESGKLTILEVKKANDDEISEDWCNSLL